MASFPVLINVFFHPQATRCSHHVINSYKTPEWEEATLEGWYFFLSLSSFQKFKNRLGKGQWLGQGVTLGVSLITMDVFSI